MTGIFDTSRAAAIGAVGVATTVTFLLVAGCASTSAGEPGSATRPAQATGSSHAAVAAQDAVSLFGALPTPPGATRLTAAPAGVPALSGKLPPETPIDPDLVQRTAWWSSTESPTSLLSWIAAHPPAGTSPLGSSSTNSGTGIPLSTKEFSAPAKAGVTSQELVEATISALPSGGTAVREDVIVTYLPTKSAAETIPSAASVVVTAVLPMGQPTAAAAGSPVTVTDPALIAEITSLVNGLPAASAGTVNCPMDNGAGLRLNYRDASGGQIAEVDIAATGCRGVSMTVGGAKQPALSGGQQLSSQIMTIVGTHWQLTNP